MGNLNVLHFIDFPSPDPDLDGTPTQVGNLDMGAFHVASAAPDPRPAPYGPAVASSPAPRVYILVGDDDSEAAILECAAARDAEVLWSDLYSDEFKGFHGGFRDPWGTLGIVWTKRKEDDPVRPEQTTWGTPKGYPESVG